MYEHANVFSVVYDSVCVCGTLVTVIYSFVAWHLDSESGRERERDCWDCAQ